MDTKTVDSEAPGLPARADDEPVPTVIAKKRVEKTPADQNAAEIARLSKWASGDDGGGPVLAD